IRDSCAPYSSDKVNTAGRRERHLGSPHSIRSLNLHRSRLRRFRVFQVRQYSAKWSSFRRRSDQGERRIPDHEYRAKDCGPRQHRRRFWRGFSELTLPLRLSLSIQYQPALPIKKMRPGFVQLHPDWLMESSYEAAFRTCPDHRFPEGDIQDVVSTQRLDQVNLSR